MIRTIHIQDDKVLFNQIAEGDEIAFRTIYDAYFDRLATYAFKMSKSEEVAEEVVQDVFMKLWVNRASLKNIETPLAYIFSIARNSTIDYLRTLAKETDLIANLTANLHHDVNYAVQKFDTLELQRLISEAMAGLSKQKQIVFHLSKYEDLSHDEIAEELKLSKSTIKNHLSETMKYLRKNMRLASNSEALLILFLICFLNKGK